jgi:hypothetical protein
MYLGVGWAMLAAAVAGFGIGAAWYGIFSEPWMKAAGRTREELKPSALIWLVAIAANLLIAFVLGNIMGSMGISGWSGGLITGFFMWLGFTIPVLVMNNGFAGRPVNLTVIDGGHALLNICVQGLVLGYFGPGGSSF